MPITKSTGVTDTERMLAEFCEKTFLRLWSYPNPFKDDGHEVCDLLVVFEEHVFIFFDREGRQFANTERDPLLNWDRWRRDVVGRQVKTAHGAERYLRSGRKVFLDAKGQVPFPIDIPADRMVVHKIVVAHGAKEACEQFSAQNVYGSLGVGYGEKSGAPDFPFMVDLDRSNPVHVLDSHNLAILFGEFDTITDLQMYFEAKAKAIAQYDLLLYCGEEDLIAHYYGNFDKAEDRHFIGVRNEGEINGVFIGEGEWKGLIERPEYKAKKEADQDSYLWDEIIQRTCQNALDGTLLGNARLLEGRSAIHEMAREPRFSRRALSAEMIRVISNFPDSEAHVMRHVTLMPSFYDGKAYVFLQLRVKGETDDNPGYREKRRWILELACGAAKNRFPELKTIVGIAVDAPKFSPNTAEDFLLMDCTEWAEEQRRYFEKENELWGFFNSPSLQMRERTVQISRTCRIPQAANRKRERPRPRHPHSQVVGGLLRGRCCFVVTGATGVTQRLQHRSKQIIHMPVSQARELPSGPICN